MTQEELDALMNGGVDLDSIDEEDTKDTQKEVEYNWGTYGIF